MKGDKEFRQMPRSEAAMASKKSARGHTLATGNQVNRALKADMPVKRARMQPPGGIMKLETVERDMSGKTRKLPETTLIRTKRISKKEFDSDGY